MQGRTGRSTERAVREARLEGECGRCLLLERRGMHGDMHWPQSLPLHLCLSAGARLVLCLFEVSLRLLLRHDARREIMAALQQCGGSGERGSGGGAGCFCLCCG